jgi:hypothetical protein
MSAYNLPPTYDKIQKHAVFPDLSHDENARYNFLANLNKHISQVVLPANKTAFDKRVQPAFRKENGRDCGVQQWKCANKRAAQLCCDKPIV